MDDFPLPEDHFDGAANITERGAGLVSLLNQLHSNVPDGINTRTTQSEFRYADFDNGDDGDDGLSWETATKTIQRAHDLLPFRIAHNSGILYRGDHNQADTTSLTKFVDQNIWFGLAGDPDLVDTIAGPFTCDGGDTFNVTVGGAGWTPEVYSGYWIRFTSGALAGQTRNIQQSTADTINPCRPFTASPIGLDFEVIAPAANHESTLFVANQGPGYTLVQDAFFGRGGGGGLLSLAYAQSAISITHCMSNSSNSFAALQGLNCASVGLYGARYNPLTFAFQSPSISHAGMSIRSLKPTIMRGGTGLSACQGSVLGNVDLYECFTLGAYFGFGSRVRGKLDLNNVGQASSTLPFAYNFTSYAKLKIDGSAGVGLKVTDSAITIGGSNPMVIENCSGHALEVSRGGSVRMDIAVEGAGNQSGAYVHTNGNVLVKAGVTPTVTGSIGDITTDGAAPQANDWAAVAGGSRVVDTDELALIKRV